MGCQNQTRDTDINALSQTFQPNLMERKDLRKGLTADFPCRVPMEYSAPIPGPNAPKRIAGMLKLIRRLSFHSQIPTPPKTKGNQSNQDHKKVNTKKRIGMDLLFKVSEYIKIYILGAAWLHV